MNVLVTTEAIFLRLLFCHTIVKCFWVNWVNWRQEGENLLQLSPTKLEGVPPHTTNPFPSRRYFRLTHLTLQLLITIPSHSVDWPPVLGLWLHVIHVHPQFFRLKITYNIDWSRLSLDYLTRLFPSIDPPIFLILFSSSQIVAPHRVIKVELPH